MLAFRKYLLGGNLSIPFVNHGFFVQADHET
jgi:hypothetical protein